jgi:hypothetical protein
MELSVSRLDIQPLNFAIAGLSNALHVPRCNCQLTAVMFRYIACVTGVQWSGKLRAFATDAEQQQQQQQLQQLLLLLL